MMREDAHLLRVDDSEQETPLQRSNTILANSTGLVVYRKKTEQVVALKATKEQLSALHEPYVHSAFKLRRKKVLAQSSSPDVVRAFAQLSQTIMQGFKNALIVITSSVPKGGTSLVSLNLAIALARHERNTSLIVDCSLEQPSFYRFLLKRRRVKGLSDYVEDLELSEEEIIHPTGIPKVRLVPRGNRELTGEAFGSARMLELLANTQHRYPERYVIVDAPSIGKSAYVGLLAECSDCVLLVTPYGKTKAKDIKNAVKTIGTEKLLGCVLNNEPRLSIF